ncbi:MAG: HepT-like ribonuclease domain-containing protein [Nanoarchaeota archaeon]
MSYCDLYTNQIREIITKIEFSLKGKTEQDFVKSDVLKDATLMRLQAIGELVKKIPLEIKKKNKEIKWKKFESLRNVISHQYMDVKYGLIWNFIKNNLNELKQALSKIK